MSKPTNSIELKLFGQKIALKHKADDPELVRRTVSLVTAKIAEAQAKVPKGSAPHYVSLIALLELAAEYLQAKDRTEEFKRDVDRKSAEIRGWIETELG